MAGTRWELIADGFGRLEAPCLDLHGRLCFSDIRSPGGVHRLADGATTKLVDREDVGGLVAHAGGGLVASGRTVSVLDDDGSERVVLEPQEGGWGFNDLTTDAHGNVYVGMHGEQPTLAPPSVSASLWRIGGNGVDRCYDGIQLTNGLRFSPDGARLYHNDTFASTVWVSDIDDAGIPVNRRPHWTRLGARPDGMTMDEVGCPWVALIGAGTIVRLTPEGAEDVEIELPRKWVASLCFGNDGELFAVTFGGEPFDPEHSGAVFRTTVDVAGAPLTPARV